MRVWKAGSGHPFFLSETRRNPATGHHLDCAHSAVRETLHGIARRRRKPQHSAATLATLLILLG